MPASSSDNICQIEETLKSSLGSGAGDLDSDISSSSKRILLTQIVFKPAEKPYTLQIDSLRQKYIPLNPSQNTKQTENGGQKQENRMNGSGEGNDGFPVPKVVLYPEENIKLEWKKISRIGAGLVNMGNTCFLNSTLQCLTYTAPLVNYCLSNEHSDTCKQIGFCMMCELQRHIKRCYENYGNAIKPQSILQKLRMIAKHMHWGRQEDAHEFLRYLVEALQKSCHSNLNGLAKLDKFSKETTVVNQIFGGFLRSQVQCLKCKERSNTYDPLLDISLDIKNASTLEKAFEKYVHPEMLDNENAYMCTKCKQKVPAQKRFSIHKAPNVLTVSLKRFDFHRMMGKITRHVNFPEKLNIRPYMSIRQGEPMMYNLYAVLVHSGGHCNSGHYYCYVKSPSQVWYCMNDSMVTQVSAQRVLSSEAYLLFYIKAKPSPSQQKPKTPLIGPVQPNHIKHAVNGMKVHHINDIGSPIPRKNSPLVKPQPNATSTKPNVSSTFMTNLPGVDKMVPKPAASTPLPANRDRVAFGIKPKQSVKPQDANKDEKPRIVMQIKHGKVTTYEKSPDGKSKIVNGGANTTSKLVPYGGDSDSEEESNQSKTNRTECKIKEEKKVENESRHSPKHKKENNVIFDEKLNATTSVPGNTHLLGTLKDERVNGSAKVKDERLNGVTKVKHGGHSPDRKHAFENLTCVTSTKVNATSNWHIFNPDSVLSPSRGSNSSKESTNSTTHWDIKESKDIGEFSKVPDRQHAGWKVMEDKKTSGHKDGPNHNTPQTEHGHSVAPPVYKTIIDVRQPSPVAVSDKQSLISPEKHKKHKKKKHKHKRDHDDEKCNDDSLKDESRPKKHKKKKHKHKEQDEDRKLKRHGDDSSHHHGDVKKRKSESDSESSAELVWVEKTKDSLVSTPIQNVPVQAWDHHVKDGFKRMKNGFHGNSKPTWDGSKTSSVAETLVRNSSAHGYGSSVLSWDGEKSIVDREIEKEKERKRHWSDEYDEEIDTGKVKKVKKHLSDTDFHKLNPFQYVQGERNKDTSKHGHGSHSVGQSHSYHNHSGNHHRNHHHSYHDNKY